MFTDVCFPRGNEEKFLDTAKKLSIRSVCFIYYDSNKIKKAEKKGIAVYSGGYKNSKQRELDVIFSDNLMENRQFGEKIVFFLDIERFFQKNKLTQVMIKELAASKKLVGVPISQIFNKPSVDILEKLRMFIRLCKKYKVPLYLASFAESPEQIRTKKDIAGLASCLGMNQKEIKNSMAALSRFFTPPPFP
jgi:hypothetical protein